MTDKTGRAGGKDDANRDTTATTAAEKVATTQDPEGVAVNPYPAYDLMTLDDLRALAEERDVHIPRDVEKALLITELRAADTRTN